MKSLYAVLFLAACTAVATAQTTYKNAVCDPASSKYPPGNPVVKTIIAGSSAMWTTMALGAYNQGNGPAGSIPNTHHYVSSASFNVVDTRPLAFGSANAKYIDSGTVWIVWDEHTAYVSGTGTTCAPDVWAYVDTDSLVGTRAVFGSSGAGGITQPGGAPYGVFLEDSGHMAARRLNRNCEPTLG